MSFSPATQRCRWRRVRAALLVELSLMLAIVAIISFAAIELSWTSMLRQATDDAAYEAARRAIATGGDRADAEAAARETLGELGVESFRFSMVPVRHQETTTHVVVRVEVPIDESGWPTPRFNRGRVLRSEVRLMADHAPLVLRDAVRHP